ncbi:MAG TPA: adenylate kinase [Erysipelothrix sp.]|nr:adenylate kinase [Erysipelothrix sp.]
MNLLIMGPAGSGKGTMSRKIAKKFGIPHIATGDMFRDAISKQTPVGKEAKDYLDQGKLVPDEVTNRMVKERITMDDCQNGYLLDGYPRNLFQADAFSEISYQIDNPLDYVINLNIPYDELVKRITGRRICKDCGKIYHIEFNPPKVPGVCDKCGGELYQRTDDTEEKFNVRHEDYINQTEPVIDYYREQGLVHDIDATQSIDKVWSVIEEFLEAVK